MSTGKRMAHTPRTVDMEPTQQKTWIDELKDDRKSFFVKVGQDYDGVSFTIDPAFIEFQETDSLNELITNREVDLERLVQVFKKCPSIENLKFFGIKIPDSLLKLIADNCPNLVNLELNPYEKPLYGMNDERGLVNSLPKLKNLLDKCPGLKRLVIREPSEEIEHFFRNHNNFGFDKVDRNYYFSKAGTETVHATTDHHNVVLGRNAGRSAMYIGSSHIAGHPEAMIYQVSVKK